MTNIEHPDYYTYGKIETWDFIADKNLCFDLGNAIKYIVRAGVKDPDTEVEDLEKAICYIRHRIEIAKRDQAEWKGDTV